MLIHGKPYTTIWTLQDQNAVEIIDQRFLPFQFIIEKIDSVEGIYTAIKDMHLRGAPLIGVAAAYGLWFSSMKSTRIDDLKKDYEYLLSARPTAVNLKSGLDFVMQAFEKAGIIHPDTALKACENFRQFEIDNCHNIGLYGVELIEEIARKKAGETVNILTHCNAGWLACINYGTATAPIYEAWKRGINIHVWVDETRPRNQGARLTAFELTEMEIPHTLICDNTGGHLMQHGQVDIVIVGSDRTTLQGDVCNKVGTYLKALAAKANNVPFYAALPTTTIDRNIKDGVAEIEIEERAQEEVTHIEVWDGEQIQNLPLCGEKSPALNIGFDVSPAHLISGIITEKGICEANEKAITTILDKAV